MTTIGPRELEFTGEYAVPVVGNEHLIAQGMARYKFAAQLCKGAVLLDVGCGEGYGIPDLVRFAHQVIAIDRLAHVVQHAATKYPTNRAQFLAMDAADLGFRGCSFDSVTSFEVIEHVTDYQRFLQEISRVLRPSGVFIVSTPNNPDGCPSTNPYHVHEFQVSELRSVLYRFFTEVQLYGQNEQRRISPLHDKLRRMDSMNIRRLLGHPRFRKLRAPLLRLLRSQPFEEVSPDEFLIAEGFLGFAPIIVGVCRQKREK